MSQSDIGRICNEISSDSRWSHLTVYKAELSTKECGLNFKQLLSATLKVQFCSFGVSTLTGARRVECRGADADFGAIGHGAGLMRDRVA